MSNLLDKIRTCADAALENDAGAMSNEALIRSVERLAKSLKEAKIQSAALYADNSIEWIVVDLACLDAGICLTPLPLFFSPDQVAHALATCGAQAFITDRPIGHLRCVQSAGRTHPMGSELAIYIIDPDGRENAALPEGTQKITFTSGTTGTPKGVCLSAAQQIEVASALSKAVSGGSPRHLCALPMSTLLENLAGVYAPLLANGTVIAPSLTELGLRGSSQLDVPSLLASISRYRPTSLILVPQMLTALTAAAEQGWAPPASLSFVAVGGGKVSADLLHQARAVGLPVFEGYGLSECASVVSLNLPGADRPGTAGRPLPHVKVVIDEGEIVVSGNTFLGYAGAPESWNGAIVRTGDLGRIDESGFVVIEGRRKNLLISSYGRNLSPEWVEAELLSGPMLQQAVVFGDARPWCIALVLPRDPNATDQAIAQWLEQINTRLPDYAQVREWARLAQPLSSRDGTATANGRPRRPQIEIKYRAVIDGLYSYPVEACSQ